jgi:hypothetical protein
LKTLYRNGSSHLYFDGKQIYFEKNSFFEKKIHQIPIEDSIRKITFSRYYHLSFLVLPALVACLSIDLVVLKWEVFDWSVYLGITILFLFALILVTYLAWGKKYGEVLIHDLDLTLFMTKKKYEELVDNISNLNNYSPKKNVHKFKYHEEFPFRTKVHTLINSEIRTQTNSFFESSEILTKIEHLGHRLQYKSDLKLFDIFVSIVFLIFGITGILYFNRYGFQFVIAFGLIFCAIYWIISIVYHASYVGDFYLSNTIEKSYYSYEIKSKYPASNELKLFLNELRSRQKDIAIEKLLMFKDSYEKEEKITQATYIKNTFSISNSEFDSLMDRLTDEAGK